jgi:hypothetical protein
MCDSAFIRYMFVYCSLFTINDYVQSRDEQGSAEIDIFKFYDERYDSHTMIRTIKNHEIVQHS